MNKLLEIELPASVQELAEYIGVEKALTIVSRLKTDQLYIPKHIPHEHWIIDAIGINAARKLQREFGGILLKMATCRYIHIQRRNMAIIEDFQSGIKPEILAVLYGLTPRQIFYILKKVKEK